MNTFQVSLIGQDSKVLLEGVYKCLNKLQTIALFNHMIKDKDPFQKISGYTLDRVVTRLDRMLSK